jgi:M6 family metalloprotease-like protein
MYKYEKMKKGTHYLLPITYSCMKKLLFTIFTVILFITQEANAVPACPYPVQYQLPDGTAITITLKGDEWINWATSPDGYSLLLNKNGFYEYAVKDATDDLILSGIRTHNENERTSAEAAFLKNVQKDLRYSDRQKTGRIQELRKAEQPLLMKSAPVNRAPKAEIETVRAPLILVDFPGKPFTKSKADFDPLMNQTGYTDNGTITGSVRDYFTASSYGQMDFQVDVFGPYTLSQEIAYYDFNMYGDPRLMVWEAVLAASADGCDFSNYDIDNDGVVDAVHVIFAGYGQEAGAPAGDAIWSHKSNTFSVNLDGKLVSPYSCSPELRGSSGNNITYIGVIAHELSHVFGLPDLYDTDYADRGQSIDVGPWDIMASGSWNDNGRTPSLHSAWSRDFLGWVPATELSDPADITLPNPAIQGVTYKLNTTTPNEYFLLENRQKTGWDSYLPSGGMLIYHVDENNSEWNKNCINCVASRRGLYVKQAGSSPIASSRLNDPYPSGNNKSFTDDSSPDSKSWAGAETKKPLTEITRNATDGTISFLFKGGSSSNLKELNGLSAHPNEGTVNGEGLFIAGTVVTLSAVPSTNYRFVCWKSGNTIVSTDNPFSFTLTGDTTLIAYFKNTDIIETIYAEDFETGADGWTFANEDQTNQWVRGTSDAAVNSVYSVYISNDNGVSNQYGIYAESVVHLYRDIELPPTTDHYQLSFDWKGNGEMINSQEAWDYLGVYLLNTDVIPAGGVDLANAPLSVLGNNGNWQQAFILLPDSCIGTTKRLVFTWKNDGSAGAQPPVAIDNIEIASTAFLSDVSASLSSAGTLKDSIPNAYFAAKLTVAGNIDARDIKFIRDNMPVLENLDLSGATIVRYTGADGPATSAMIYAYPDNELPEKAFYNLEFLTSVALPFGLTSIGDNALTNCGNLNSISLPQSLAIIGSGAFAYCAGLTSITLPLNLIAIKAYAFGRCTGLKSITLPKKVNSISHSVLSGCTELEEIYNLNPVPIEIPAMAFQDVDKSKCRLKVLKNACSDYRQANFWNEFEILCEYEPSADATLISLTVSEGTLTPDFDSDVVQYTVNVENSVKNMEISATPMHMYADVTGARTYALDEGENIFDVQVTAEDDITAKTYTLTVNRDEYVGIEDVDSQITVYPNPTSGMVYVRNATGATPEVTVYNVMGKMLLSTRQSRIDFSAFPEGIYLLRTGDKMIKIIKN